jgi:hypothetical protein
MSIKAAICARVYLAFSLLAFNVAFLYLVMRVSTTFVGLFLVTLFSAWIPDVVPSTNSDTGTEKEANVGLGSIPKGYFENLEAGDTGKGTQVSTSGSESPKTQEVQALVSAVRTATVGLQRARRGRRYGRGAEGAPTPKFLDKGKVEESSEKVVPSPGSLDSETVEKIFEEAVPSESLGSETVEESSEKVVPSQESLGSETVKELFEKVKTQGGTLKLKDPPIVNIKRWGEIFTQETRHLKVLEELSKVSYYYLLWLCFMEHIFLLENSRYNCAKISKRSKHL